MRIIFACNSAYQIFISAIVSELKYNHCQKYLLLDEYLWEMIKNTYNFKDNDIFNKTMVIPSNISENHIKDLLLNFNPDIIHIFNWGNSFTKMIYQLSNSLIILLDEGIGSYSIYKIWGKQGIDFDKINEIWLLQPELSTDNKFLNKIRKLNIEDLIYNYKRKKYILNKLNTFFNYSYTDISHIVYFDRYFVSENTLPFTFEKKYLSELNSLTNDYTISIKIHPSEDIKLAEYRYKDFNMKIIKNTCIPWELELLNFSSENKIIVVSINSSTLLTSKMWSKILNISIESICIIDIVKKYINTQELVIEQIVDRYNSIYNSDPIYKISNFGQLQSILNNENIDYINNNLDKRLENNWLLEEYRSFFQKIGNLLVVLKLYILDENQNKLYYDYAFFSLLDKNHTFNFKIPDEIYQYRYIKIIPCDNYVIKTLDNFVLALEYKTNKIRTYFDKQINLFCQNYEIIYRIKQNIKQIKITFELDYPIIKYDYRKYKR